MVEGGLKSMFSKYSKRAVNIRERKKGVKG